MKIWYGSSGTRIDVTDICLARLTKDGVIFVPAGDIRRSFYFTDPVYGVLKSVTVEKVGTYDHTCDVYIDLRGRSAAEAAVAVYTDRDAPDDVVAMFRSDRVVDARLAAIHRTLTLCHGKWDEEVPEQKMAVRFLTGNERVLEIGANVGRNSLVMAHLLNQGGGYLVALESDAVSAAKLAENRDANGLQFCIECAALSQRPLIQRDWLTKPWTDASADVPEGYTSVQTITWDGLLATYPEGFDTLVLDCEGAFYYILQDMPEMLDDIRLILMENDYFTEGHKEFVNGVLLTRGFACAYREAGGWGPCKAMFFEAWSKMT